MMPFKKFKKNWIEIVLFAMLSSCQPATKIGPRFGVYAHRAFLNNYRGDLKTISELGYDAQLVSQAYYTKVHSASSQGGGGGVVATGGIGSAFSGGSLAPAH